MSIPHPAIPSLTRFSRKKSLTFFFLILACTAVIIGGLWYYLFGAPRVRLVAFCTNTTQHLREVNTQLDSVNSSLQKILDTVSGKDSSGQPNNSLLLRLHILTVLAQVQRPQALPKNVAGVTTQSNSVFLALQQAAQQFTNLSERLYGKKSAEVLGEKNSESTRIAHLRNLKDMAVKGFETKNTAEKKLDQFVAYINKERYLSSPQLKEVISAIDDNNDQTYAYLLEAHKTFYYYAQITDVQIKLVPMLVSYYTVLTDYVQRPSSTLYAGRLRELQTSITAIQQQIQTIHTADLPNGIQDLHDDNLKTVEIVKNSTDLVQTSIATGDMATLQYAIEAFVEDLRPYADRAVTLELSFWQNNATLRKHDMIVGEYHNEEIDLQKLAKANKLPFGK